MTPTETPQNAPEEATTPTEGGGFLDRFSRWVTQRPAIVLALLVGAAALAATQIPKLRVDPSVENLISSHEGHDAEVAERFAEDFGNIERVMVLLLEADDIMTPDVLTHLHALSVEIGERPWVERTIGITNTPLARRIEGAPDELDRLDDLDSLDALEAEEEAGELDSDALDALLTLVEADPARFPGGVAAVGPRLSSELRATPIGGEFDEATIAELRLALSQNPLLEGRMVSADRKVVATVILLSELDAKETREHVSELRSYLENLEHPEGVRVQLGGLPYLRSTIVESIRSDQIFLVPMTLVVCMLLLAFALRWWPGVILPIVAVALTAITVVGSMGAAGEPLNILNNIIPTLLIIIGISDSIHLIGRYREEIAEGRSREEAGARTVRSMAVACLLTSVTTAVGLASLIVSKTTMLKHFGVVAGLGVMVAYVVTVLFTPAVLMWIKPPKVIAETEEHGALAGGIISLTKSVLAHRIPVLALSAALVGGAVFFAFSLKVDHALLDQFEESDPVYRTTRLMEDELDGVRPLEVSLLAENAAIFEDPEVLSAVQEVVTWAEAQEIVLSSMSFQSILKQSLFLLTLDEEVLAEPFASGAQVRALKQLVRVRTEADPLAPWLGSEGTHMRLQIKLRDAGAQASMAFIEDLEVRLAEALGDDIRVGFAGEGYNGSKGMDAVVTDLLSSLLMAIGIIFVLLTLLFRSVRLGLLSIPPNIIPLTFTMAYMVARGIPLNAATVIIFSISLGLAVDGSIHVLARYQEESRRLGPGAIDQVLLRAAAGTGHAIVISCFTLMAGFSVLLFSNFVPVQRFGELIAVTVGACLFATLVVQPALLRVAATREERS